VSVGGPNIINGDTSSCRRALHLRFQSRSATRTSTTPPVIPPTTAAISVTSPAFNVEEGLVLDIGREELEIDNEVLVTIR
jgi:hypothetical protein